MFELNDKEHSEFSFKYLGVNCEVITTEIGVRRIAVAIPNVKTVQDCFQKVVVGVLQEVPEVLPRMVSMYESTNEGDNPTLCVLTCIKRPEKVQVPDLAVILEQVTTPEIIANFKQFLVDTELSEAVGEVITCEEMITLAEQVAAFLFEQNPDNKRQLICFE